MRFRGQELADMTDEQLDDAEIYTVDALLVTAQHYRTLTAFYEEISRELERRVGVG